MHCTRKVTEDIIWIGGKKDRRTGVLGQDRAFAEDYEGTPENAGLCEGGPGSGKFI